MELETLALRGGYKPGNGDTHTMPIYQSTTWKYDTSEHMADLFDLNMQALQAGKEFAG